MNRKQIIESELKRLDDEASPLYMAQIPLREELDRIIALELAESILGTVWVALATNSGNVVLRSKELGYKEIPEGVEFHHTFISLSFIFDNQGNIGIGLDDGEWSISGDTNSILHLAEMYELKIDVRPISKSLETLRDKVVLLEDLQKTFTA